VLDRELNAFFPGKPQKINNINLSYKRPIDNELILSLEKALESQIKKFNTLKMQKVTVGLSGGVDSTVVCALLKQTELKSSAVIIEVDNHTDLTEGTKFAVALAEKIGIDYELINATKTYNDHLKLLKSNSTLARVHLRSRLINNIVFQVADNNLSIVINATDKSEDILKIYEESFRGHIAPLIELYKSELYDLADLMGLTELSKAKSGCPELLDFDAFGLDWDDLDPILYLLAEKKMSISDIAKQYKIDIKWLQGLEKRILTQPLRTTVQQVHLK
jgi:NAD+ synthase (glutamine-hydrolysing)